MSISMVTRGRLWPTGGTRVIHEYFVDINAQIDDPLNITLEMHDVTEISVAVSLDEISAQVEAVDPVTGTIVDPDDVSGNTEGCF